MKRLDQGRLHPKLEVPGLTCPGRESNTALPSGRRALWKRAIRTACWCLFGTSTVHMSPRHGSPEYMCYMNIHEYTWTALECRPNGLLPSRRLPSPGVSNHVRVTTMKRLDQGHLHPKLEVPGLTCPGRESNPAFPVEGGTLEKSHSNSFLISIRNTYIHKIRARDSFTFLYIMGKRVSNYILRIFYCAQLSSVSENSLFPQKLATWFFVIHQI
jgi:hypothetical protein